MPVTAVAAPASCKASSHGERARLLWNTTTARTTAAAGSTASTTGRLSDSGPALKHFLPEQTADQRRNPGREPRHADTVRGRGTAAKAAIPAATHTPPMMDGESARGPSGTVDHAAPSAPEPF